VEFQALAAYADESIPHQAQKAWGEVQEAAVFRYHLGLARLDQVAGRGIHEIRGMMHSTEPTDQPEVSR
jgi:hypothetical protein